MKWVSPALVFGLGLALILSVSPPAPEPDPAPGLAEPPVAVCATQEGADRSTNLAITSTVAGEGLVTVFSGGATAGTGRFETGESGTVTVPMGTISAVGEAAALVEFPTSDSAVATVSIGSLSLSAEACSRIPERQTVIGGANTLEGSALHLQLMNPYATEALVDISAFSESGREASEALVGIIVPPRSSVIIDVGNILPGRESLSMTLDTDRGSVVASLRADIEGESAVWRPVAPTESWLLAAPGFSVGDRDLIIVSTVAEDVAYQVDVYGPEGLEEEVLEGVVVGRGQQVIDLSSLREGAMAVRVVAEAPIAVFGRYSAPGGLAITDATPTSGSDWLLPGAGNVAEASTAVVIVNVGLEAADLTLTQLKDSSITSTISIEPGAVFETALDGGLLDGVAIVSDGELVPVWFTRWGAAIALSGGVRIGNE